MGRRSKKSRHRGSHTHGSGSKKKRRGAGSRGGRGKAGTGKKADQKKPKYWKDTKRFGKYGFTSIHAEENTTINVGDLYIFEETDLDLTEKGYDKLLGAGQPDTEYNITIEKASKSAQNKIEDAGGTLTLTEE